VSLQGEQAPVVIGRGKGGPDGASSSSTVKKEGKKNVLDGIGGEFSVSFVSCRGRRVSPLR